ncbi:hypothetical protein TNCV_1357331 [Trichonephila clavipes]|uniref:Uncharacterized protein n=1 Tax=Trichonephila clavipes TaxID=2585209 RepID=A0A8X6S6F4_TRICX|nr:hypothetical protein TNCV_1357331 [Trichonephila clavipes]
MNKTYKLFQLDFIRRTSKGNLFDSSPSTSSSEIMAVDPASKKMLEEKDKVQRQADIQAYSNVQLDIQNRKHLGPEYQNDIGLWRNITEDIQNFWCKRNSVECQHFDNDFLASFRQ